MKSFLQNKNVKIFFSLMIIFTSIPSIVDDIKGNYTGDLIHYGLFIIGLLTIINVYLKRDDRLLLDDIKVFYVWKQFINDPEFEKKWEKDREKVLKEVIRPTMYK